MHAEDTPSFCVYPDQHAHCFGCGWHGTVFDFQMAWFGVNFRQALAELSWEARVERPSDGPASRRARFVTRTVRFA